MTESRLPSADEHAHATWLIDASVQSRPAVSAWAALDERGLLRVDGADAETFLQGQLTQDMSRLSAGRVLFAAHCTPKGRITALFRAWRLDDGFLLDLPADLAGAAQRRLAMYVLRAKVKVSDAAAAWTRTGVAGAELGAVLEELGYPLPDQDGSVCRNGSLYCLRLGQERWLALAPAGADGGLRARLATRQPPAPADWALACLRAGEPEVVAGTVETFIPQMLNLDQLDGISFKKGCYTGQEIVARTHFLGRVKRRMRHLAYRGAGAPAPGSQVPLAGAEGAVAGPVGDDGAVARQGQIVIALQTHAEGGEALAVTTLDTEA